MSVDAMLIAGPTASGKSLLAMELAKRLNGTIINADSMQVYSELRILTARPSSVDELLAPHQLYGHVSTRGLYSAGRYQEDAGAALAQARSEGRMPIFVGGTGLYFDSLTKGLSPIPAVPEDIRAATRLHFEAIGRDAFLAELATFDPVIAAKLSVSDTQRLLRAMDVLRSSGRPLSHWQAMSGQPVLSGLQIARYVLAPPREVRNQRIDRRFEIMVKAGALEEAREMSDLDPVLPAAKALGLPQLRRHLGGEISLSDAIAEAQLATKHYGKRQMTWFRTRMRTWNWIEDEQLSNFIASTERELS
jgi:tRNA dimethylallyltransferase